MGNSADRAWQLSQLVEGVLTACNPSHGSLSYVQARRCVSKQIGQHDAARQGCPRCVSRSPETRCLRVFARAVRFFPTCGVVRVADIKLSTTHEKFSQLRMKIKQVRRIVVSAILDIAGEVRLYLGGNATPFVQRGRIAQENSSMLHHGSGEHE